MQFDRGIEAIVRARSSDKQEISSTIAVPLILGFTLMLLMDQVISPHTHLGAAEAKFSAPYPLRTAQSDSTVDFDAELSELEREEAGGGDGSSRRAQTPIGINNNSDIASTRKKAMSMTLGLVVHALADGLVLGVSSVTDTVSTSLPMLVFLALVIHKGMHISPPLFPLLNSRRFSTNVSRACFFTSRDWTAARGVQEAYYGLRIGHPSRGAGFFLFLLFPR